jgi:Flp pilus assembly protein TadG
VRFPIVPHDHYQEYHAMKSRRRTRGQALVEFALIVPIFVIVIFGIIDLGRYVFTANAVSNAAREGSRIGSVGSRPPACATLSREQCVITIADDNAWGVSSPVTTTVTCEAVAAGDPTPNPIAVSACGTDDLLKVRSQTTFNLLTPLISQFIGNLTIAGESRVTVNN